MIVYIYIYICVMDIYTRVYFSYFLGLKKLLRQVANYIQVEPGKPGVEVSKGKEPKNEFAYRMCAGRPTSAMPKPRFLCARVSPFHLVVAFLRWLVVFPRCVGGGDVKNHVMWCGQAW